jgi:hypothetical protein
MFLSAPSPTLRLLAEVFDKQTPVKQTNKNKGGGGAGSSLGCLMLERLGCLMLERLSRCTLECARRASQLYWMFDA